MKKYLVVILLLTMGCASSLKGEVQSVMDRYETVRLEDGVSLEEAKLVAQKELIRDNFVRLYDFLDPRIDKNVSDLPHYQDYWFVFFKEKDASHIEFVYMAIIHKQTGRVKFADDFARDKRWILEASLLQR